MATGTDENAAMFRETLGKNPSALAAGVNALYAVGGAGDSVGFGICYNFHRTGLLVGRFPPTSEGLSFYAFGP